MTDPQVYMACTPRHPRKQTESHHPTARHYDIHQHLHQTPTGTPVVDALDTLHNTKHPINPEALWLEAGLSFAPTF